MIYFKRNRTHRKNAKKDLVHIVKVSDDTFAQSEITPIFGIMLCVLSLIFRFKTTVDYVMKNISIIITIYLYQPIASMQSAVLVITGNLQNLLSVEAVL